MTGERIRVWERALVLAATFVGLQAMLHFAAWWLSPEHRKHLVVFIPLTFGSLWLLYQTCVFWIFLASMRIPAHRPPKPGLRVDVFTTAAPGEPLEMFAQSLPAMVAMCYPHRTWLLDGSGDPALAELAQQVGASRIDCTGISGAKAGKVNHALTEADGEFVLILDPDHVAQPEFLDRVLGHFEDDDVGFVQVVQAYYNQSVSFVARAAAEQTYGFYGPILMGMNRFGGPLVIGANCTFRRRALDSIGGHAVHLVEDFVTSLRMHAQGWRSVYVPEILARGLAPEDLRSFFGQQLKWATGMFQVLFSMMPRMLLRLRPWQTLRYLISSTYYFIGLALAINLILPIAFLFTGMWAVEMPIRGYVAHLMPFLLLFVIIHWLSQRWMRDRRERGWQWRAMLLQLGTWPIYVLALLFVLAGRRVPYLPTPKTRQLTGSLDLVLPHILIVAGSIAATIAALASPLRDYAGTRLMVFFAALNSLLMLPAIGIAVTETVRARRLA